MKARMTWGIQREAWQSFVDRCPNATFFHTPGWYLAHAESLGYKLATVHIRFEGGREALLPMATRRKFKGLLREAMAGIETGYGGLVSPQPLSQDQVDEAYRLVLGRYPDLVITGNPHEAYSNLPSWLVRDEDCTQVALLLPPEEQRKQMSKSRVKTIRAAHEEGYDLIIKRGLSVRDVQEFYGCYAEHAAEWNYTKWVRDEEYFRALLRHGGQDMVLFLAYRDEFLAGFRLLGCYGRNVMALNVARAKRYKDWSVGPYLAAESMAWCHAEGYDAMDFMPSGRLESVRSYKASFGGRSVPHAVASHSGAVGASAQVVRQLLRGAPARQASAS